MRGAKDRFRVLGWMAAWSWVLCALAATAAWANLAHVPVFPNIKVMMIAYGNNYPDEQRVHGLAYDAIIGKGQGAGDTPYFTYTNYYCMYVGNDEYKDAQQWAQAQGVDFEAFFLHYSEDTVCHPYGDVSYTVPAGSRVPTYQWYGTGGDMTKTGARVVMNVGNANYRAWKLDYVTRQLQQTNADGIFVDNTSFTTMPGGFTVTSGGTVAEYPTDLISQLCQRPAHSLPELLQRVRRHEGADGEYGSGRRPPRLPLPVGHLSGGNGPAARFAFLPTH